MNNIIEWTEGWYHSQYDGEWEHEYGIKIYTIDNPGWYIVIDLKYTRLEEFEIEVTSIETSENDWYFYLIEKGRFKASGDPSKLNFLLNKFKEIVESL